MAGIGSMFTKFKVDPHLLCLKNYSRTEFFRQCSKETDPATTDKTEKKFRVLQILPPKKANVNEAPPVKEFSPPRTTNMSTDQNWINVWPGPRTFHPAVVPLPIRQGANKHGPPPDKYGNAELMKIPNFLHLTPPAIAKHCSALKSFCTKWPEALDTEENIEKHFPIEVISSDYCHSSPSIRNPLARIISIRIKLKNLKLEGRSKDKFLRLVGERYDPKTDYVTITTDSCPIKKQNYNYAYFLLTALYFESLKKESWEDEKSMDDMETYIFSERKAYNYLKETFDYDKTPLPDIKEFGQIFENLVNEGDSISELDNLKKATMKLLSLPSLKV